MRQKMNMNLGWKFSRGDFEMGWYSGFDDSEWRNVTLPHDWTITEPYDKNLSSGTGYLPAGLGWYRKKFKVPPEAERVLVTFEGVYNNSQVWCNSNYLGKRPYGYSTFTYDITDFVEDGRENVLSVRVNHEQAADSRWYTGSGITRNVYLTLTEQAAIDTNGIFISTPVVSEQKATVRAEVTVNGGFDHEIENIIYDEAGNIIAQGKVCELEVENPSLWSPDTPDLYTMKTRLIVDGKYADEVITPFGIRYFYFDADKGFFLNGKHMKLKGVCLHHEAGCLGAAVHKNVWVRKLKKLKTVGCNAIRTSHNPPDVGFLDLCDEMGFLVIDEAFDEWEGPKNKWWQGHNIYPPKRHGYFEDFPVWGETDLRDMILRDRNHPSIIMWSIGNEIDYPNDPYCHEEFKNIKVFHIENKPEKEMEYDPHKPNAKRIVPISKRLVKCAKELDMTRPVTAALAFPELSNRIGFAQTLDVVGYNYKEHLYGDDHKQLPGMVIYGSENAHHRKTC